MSATPRIPIIMYHSVGRRLPGWLWENLTIDVDMFEKQIKLLKQHNYECTDLDEYKSCQEAGRMPAQRKVVLTFDDGYVDNWVFAYPILKREGWRGTIYVNPEFIDPSDEPRLNLEDVWSGRCAIGDLQLHGFLNRAEIELMHKSGVMEIASHSMSHTWFPTSSQVVDFHRPSLDTPWLAWNKAPERKHAYLTEDQSQLEAFGFPIHKNGRSLGIRSYLPEPKIAATATGLVAENGGRDFFDNPQWETELRQAIAPWVDKGRLETDEEMTARFDYEILQSKSILEEITGSAVQHFCWPGGAYNDDSWAHMETAGYSTVSVASHDRGRWHSDNPSLVRRIGCGSNFSFRGARYYTEDPSFLLTNCEMSLGHFQDKWGLRFRKFIGAAKTGFSPFKR